MTIKKREAEASPQAAGKIFCKREIFGSASGVQGGAKFTSPLPVINPALRLVSLTEQFEGQLRVLVRLGQN